MVQSQPRQIVHTHTKMELQNRAGGVVQRKDLKPHAPLVIYHRISSKAAPVETKEGKLHAGHRAWGDNRQEESPGCAGKKSHSQ
jgi:hypothetical protein